MAHYSNVPIAGFKILIVEDEPLIAHHIATIVQEAGCKVVGPTGKVAEALELIYKRLPDLAILDVQLRGEQSYPIAEKLREQTIPFIFLTGKDEAELRPRKLDSEVVLSKPFTGPQIIKELRGLAKRTFT